MNSSSQPFTGNHATANLIDCAIDFKKLNVAKMQTFIETLCKKHSLEVLGGYYHEFDKLGALTGVTVLGESHISIHTWPEFKYVTVDVFLCNYSTDNSQKIGPILAEIKGFFRPSFDNETLVKR